MKRRRLLGCALAPVAALGATLHAGTAPGAQLYDETYRPQLHFSPAKNWMNDPNGLVYLDGEYHLFFQYNPLGDRWGHMSWGHAVSADLVHWRELPVAIPEDAQYMIFSGSVVVDENDTSGLGGNGVAPLVAVYTGAAQPNGTPQNQQLAYSTDRGRSWIKYAQNPVLDLGLGQFRDPKVFWYAPDNAWVMAAVLADRHQVAFFSSADLKHWTHLSDFGPAGASDGAWECPDLFALPVNADSHQLRWVLKVDVFKSAVAAGSGAQYFIGQFDGATFRVDSDPAFPGVESPAHWLDYGMDFYAAASWANLPEAQRRHVWIGWMNSHHYAQQTPTAPWRGAMSVPREVTLRSESGSLRLWQSPVPELAALRGRHLHLEARQLAGAPYRLRLGAGAGKVVEMLVEFSAPTAREFGVKVDVGGGEETRIGYDAVAQALFIDRGHSGVIPAPVFGQRRSAPLSLRDGTVRLHVFLDRSSVEVFANDGQRVMTELLFAGPLSDGIELYATGGRVKLGTFDLWELKSAVRGNLVRH